MIESQKMAKGMRHAVLETLESRRLLASSQLGVLEDEGVTGTQDSICQESAITAAAVGTETTQIASSAAGRGAQLTAIVDGPSILHTQADFDRMREKVLAGEEPWTAGWNALTSHGYSQLGSSPRPLETVIRGVEGENWAQMAIDMHRAYQLAVRWKVSGDTRYADEAVKYLDAWSSTHKYLTGNTNVSLASGLYGFGWAAAADIMRSYPDWAAADVTQFQNYLLSVYYPLQHDFLVRHHDTVFSHYWANWDLANIEGMMAVGIFTDRQDIYDEAINYLFNGKGNGALDKAFYFLHPGNLMQWQESGRDQGHTVLGMGLFGHIAQMAWNQGLDLFSYNNYQFLAAAEYIAKYNLGYDVPFQTYNWGLGRSGTWQQHTAVSGAARGHAGTGYELIHAHYVERLGMAAPYTTQRVLNLRPEWRGVHGDEFGFGTLTYPVEPITTGLTPRGLTAAEKGTGNIQLDWFGTYDSTSYNIYRSTSENGTYTKIASNITGLLTYTDRDLPAGIYHYRVTGNTPGGETSFSEVVSATSAHLPHTHLPFDEGTGVVANDATGNGHTGTLVNGATWGPGRTGNAVSLDGANDYVDLPDGFVGDLSDFSFAAWVYLDSAATWSRIFDFGDDRGNWMFLTPRNAHGVVEFATSTVYGYNKQWLLGTSALPTNQWVHVAVTLSDDVGRLYVNGSLVGTNPHMDFPPTQIGSTPRNWLGRSQFPADPYLDGRLDDVQIHRGTLTAGEIYTMATGRPAPEVPDAPVTLTATPVVGRQINLNWSSVDDATSYTVKRSTSSGGPYDVLAAQITGTGYTDTGLIEGVAYYYVVAANNAGGESMASPEASATALPPYPTTPSGLNGKPVSSDRITLSWSAAADAAGYNVKRATTPGGSYTTIASNWTGTTFTDTGLTAGTSYAYVVSSVNASGESMNSTPLEVTASDLLVHLKFDEASGTTAADAGGNRFNAALVNGATWTSGQTGNAVDLDGLDGHVALPAGLLDDITAVTLSAWVYLDVNNAWSRIFDFGSGMGTNMFLTPRNGADGNVRFAIKSGGGAEQQINTTTTLLTGTWTHVAVTLGNGAGVIYINGTEAGRNDAVTLTPDSLGHTTQNWIGRSQYPDPFLDGRVDDLRIYNRALGASEIGTLADGNVEPTVTASQFHVQTAPQRLSFTFDTDVSAGLSAGDLLVQKLETGETIATSLAYAAETNTATFAFSGFAGGILPDGNYRAILLAGSVTDAAGNPLAEDVTLDFFVLAGDANRDRKVDFSDFLILRSNFGRSDDPLFSEGDFNYDGKCDFADFLILRGKFGTNLPPPSSGSLFSGEAEDDEVGAGGASSVLPR